MIRATALCLALSATFNINTAHAQTIDVVPLPDGQDLTINRDEATGQQTLNAGEDALLAAATITSDLQVTDREGTPVGTVIYAESGEPGCAASPYVVTLAFGVPWVQGPIGMLCAPYIATARAGLVIFTSPSDLAQDGDVVVFDLNDGPVRMGPVAFAPQPGRGWDALDAEVGGYSDMSALDLYSAEPVYDALNTLWGEDLFALAQHLRTRTVPVQQGNLLAQSGCLPAQCAFAIGLIAVDPGNEEVYSAYFNEGAPDIRPPLESWSEEATALYNTWREGGLR
ncbi:MAG: hypothetical protein AB8B88_04345 [Devosiaceae bacterium]